jgi:hypothetical protein
MRGVVTVAVCIGAVAAAFGCASILSIPDRSLGSIGDGGSGDAQNAAVQWCNRPENKHDFCEDFDHPDAGGAPWLSGQLAGATFKVVPSDDSPPNAADFATVPQDVSAQTVTGLFTQFTSRIFDHVVVETDVRFVDLQLDAGGGLASELGFLLIEDVDFCVGIVMTPSGIGTIMRSHTTDCTSVSNIPVDAGTAIDDAGLTTFAIVGPVPNLNEWFHTRVDVKRNADGSGMVSFNINFPGVIAAPQIPPGYLTATSTSFPLVAIAASVVGPTGHIEVQFDNVTVDFPKN